MPGMTPVNDEAALDAALRSNLAVIFKHSTICPVSAAVHGQICRFLEACAGTPVYLVDVREHRDLSDRVAETLGVRHESPQVILVRDGTVLWHASHFDVKADRLAEHVAKA